jgi:RimJ/RimL family protein N-acetyltransferase
MLAMDRDPEIARRFGWAVDDAALWRCEAAIEGVREAWRRGEKAAFAVRESAEGRMLGTVEARREDDGRVELSWMTVPALRGRGIASRAAHALRDWCFATGADAVWASIEHDNAPSLGVARSLGMSEDHCNGDWVHLVVRRSS